MLSTARWGRFLLLGFMALLPLGCSDQVSDFIPPSVFIEGQSGGAGDDATASGDAAAVARPSIRDEISVATWNIQVFGRSKIAKPEVMETIVDVIRRFDVIAIQEVRSSDQSVISRFLSMVNEDGYRYGVVVGPRIGRTVSKEQYLFLYDTSRIEMIEGSVYTVPDPRDRLHREPLVASFRVVGALSGNPWTFTLVNIHTDPDEVESEVDALYDVVRLVRQTDSEDDVILMGDLNAGPDELGSLADLPNLMWTVHSQPTNTRKTETYDNILFSGTSTQEFTGAAGVLDLEYEYALTREQALDVSDHLPVWATFAPVETPARIAVR
ncbi:MAG: endonuclease/exonuclease/phosphatase family protein [Maioricimonas sp. JB049]